MKNIHKAALSFGLLLLVAAAPASKPATGPVANWNTAIQAAITTVEKVYRVDLPPNPTSAQKDDALSKREAFANAEIQRLVKQPEQPLVFIIDNVVKHAKPLRGESMGSYVAEFEARGHMEWKNPPLVSKEDHRPGIGVVFYSNDASLVEWKIGEQKTIVAICSDIRFDPIGESGFRTVEVAGTRSNSPPSVTTISGRSAGPVAVTPPKTKVNIPDRSHVYLGTTMTFRDPSLK